MYKNLLLIPAMLFITMSSFSQDHEGKIGYLSISGGASIPTGEFTADNSYAPAKTGYNFSINFNKTEWDNFGFSSTLFGQIIPVNTESLSNLYESKVTSNDWIFGGALFGGYGYFPIEKGPLAIEALLMIGGVYTQFPDLEISGILKQTGGVSYSFAYLLGSGINYRASNSICLLANINYLGSTPEYESISAGFATINTKKTSQSVGTINISFGVGFIF